MKNQPEHIKGESNQEKTGRSRKFTPYLVLILAVAITFLLTSLYYTNKNNQVLQTGPQPAGEEADLSTLIETYYILEDQYLGEYDSKELIDGALSGMVSAIDDPYTDYYPEDESEVMDQSISGSFEGIGAEVMKEGEFVKIVAPIPGSPAEKAALQPNDLIIEVEGESTSGQTLNDVVSKIRGEKGTEVTLTIRRGDNESTVTVTRDSIPIETVTYQVDPDHENVGHVQIRSFSEPTVEELTDALKDLEEQGIEKVILDVRKNPGGLLDAALRVSNIFIPDGEPIMSMEDNDGKMIEFRAGPDYGEYKYQGEVVLLVDEGSASASEILAGALQAQDIPIVGQKTFGKGLVQSVIDLSNSGDLKLTTAKWLTASGDFINEKGIQPDVEVELPAYSNLMFIDSTQEYSQGQQSDEVKNVNAILQALGFPAPDSDTFTEETTGAVREFQRNQGLEETGVVTGETSTLLVEQIMEKIEANDTQYQKALETILKD